MIRRLLLASFMAAALAPGNAGARGLFGTGVRYERWTSNYSQELRGWEAWMPLSFSQGIGSRLDVYGTASWGHGHYVNTLSGATASEKPTAFTDTTAGANLSFRLLGRESLLNLEASIPTGREEWETLQTAANVPTDFVASRYQGRGFGMSALLATAFSGTGGDIGMAAGYLYSGAFNPEVGLTDNDLKMGDTLFVAVNRVSSSPSAERIRLSATYFLRTQKQAIGVYQMGPAVSAAYGRRWGGFSVDAGVQVFTKAHRGGLETAWGLEERYSLGPRLTVAPSWERGRLTLNGRTKWILKNGYDMTSTQYVGGGYLLGMEPVFRLAGGPTFGWNLSASYDYVCANNAGLTAEGVRADAVYHRLVFGTGTEVRW